MSVFFSISLQFVFFRFIEERSFVSDMDMAGLAFFDECTERIDEENGKVAFFNTTIFPFFIYESILKKVRSL